MQTSFKATLTLFLVERAADKALILCSAYATEASAQETGGGSLLINWLNGTTDPGERLKEAHRKLRRLQHTELFSVSEKEVSKQMLRNYRNTTMDKCFQIKGDVCYVCCLHECL